MKDNDLTRFYDPDYLYDLSKKYSIDPGFVLATFILETGWGKVGDPWLNGYNPAGIMCKGTYCKYETAEQGIEEMYKLLRTYADGTVDYIGKRNTVETVRDKWSSAKDTDKIVALWRSIYDKGRDKAS